MERRRYDLDRPTREPRKKRSSPAVPLLLVGGLGAVGLTAFAVTTCSTSPNQQQGSGGGAGAGGGFYGGYYGEGASSGTSRGGFGGGSGIGG